MYQSEEKFYRFCLIILTLCSLILVVPIPNKFNEITQSIVTWSTVTHVFLYFYASILDNKGTRIFHVFGILGFFLHPILVINYFVHLLVAFVGYRSFLRMNTYIKTGYDERLERRKNIEQEKELQERERLAKENEYFNGSSDDDEDSYDRWEQEILEKERIMEENRRLRQQAESQPKPTQRKPTRKVVVKRRR